MTERPSLATVIPFRKSRNANVEAPSPRFREAALVNAQFAIDGREPFWGHHDPNRRWNGWATPGFTREVAGQVAEWVNEDEPGSAWWEGETLHLRGDGTYIEEIGFSRDPIDVRRGEFEHLATLTLDATKQAPILPALKRTAR